MSHSTVAAKTRRYRFTQWDVFTREPFGGNQLAVFLDAQGLSDAHMQAIACEMNYSETTFVLPPEPAHEAIARVRIFTPTEELPFAGHPTVGTTFALAHAGHIAPGTQHTALQLNIGRIAVDLRYAADHVVRDIWMHQPLPTFAAWQGDRERLSAALGLDTQMVDESLPIEIGSSGLPYVYLAVRSLTALAAARPTPDLLDAIGDTSGHAAIVVFTLATNRDATNHDATDRDARPSYAAQARMFPPYLSIGEDAATGSAAGPFGAYLLRHGRAPAPRADGTVRIDIAQGIEMGRPSQIGIEIERGGDGMPHDVRVGGGAVLVAEGDLLVRQSGT